MKVVLKKDIANVGKRGDVKIVSDGYAMNFLFPKKFAEPASDATLARIEAETAKKAAVKAAAEAEITAAAKALAGARLVIKAKTKDRKLFGSIDASGIAVAIAGKGIAGVTEQHIVLSKSIKETGEYPVEANFGTAKAKFLVAVEAEG
ncbi:MAG: 50S ribosomal protein L9 [Candidatus Moranbacteria bacterium]|nr:50S ribosomal protein L9 [Candidatus Moranbacteria bacterium]NTW76084.1 50S ribosomal protein L9 [Candidatus Moranbacteria bacterium]